MRIDYCDKCGRAIGLTYRIYIKEPINGKVTHEFELCRDCADELASQLTECKNKVHELRVKVYED